jgi:predicted alpha/beta hydrolase
VHPARAWVLVHPGRVRHWCGGHGKLEPVRPDTSRFAGLQVADGITAPGARTNLPRAGIRPASAYARMCGWTLARAHARSGDPIAIAEYLGSDGAFDNAIADFSVRYADQNQRDYDTFVKAIADRRIQAVTGI